MLVIEYTDTFGEVHEKFISITGETPKEILDGLVIKGKAKHALLEIEAIELFKSKGEEVIEVEKQLKITEDTYIVVDVRSRDQSGTDVLTECKHGYESDPKLRQIEGYFAYSKSHGSKVRLYIENDITSKGMKEYVRRALELHDQLNVPLEIYIKGELKSIDEVKKMVGGG
ncbi:MAG: hypothetical protein FGF50_10935 [Candidatus Brockarchaeota archaeon]|nr:hypothetical protein [Candidatus Brockarchaeota archaeon]